MSDENAGNTRLQSAYHRYLTTLSIEGDENLRHIFSIADALDGTFKDSNGNKPNDVEWQRKAILCHQHADSLEEILCRAEQRYTEELALLRKEGATLLVSRENPRYVQKETDNVLLSPSNNQKQIPDIPSFIQCGDSLNEQLITAFAVLGTNLRREDSCKITEAMLLYFQRSLQRRIGL